MRKTSTKEKLFLAAWEKYQCFGPQGMPIQEWVFTLDGDEQYRFDFCWPAVKVGVEVNGIGFGHSRIAALKRDAAKLRLAIEYGWTVLVFTSACLGSEADRELAIWQTCNQIFERGNKTHESLFEQTSGITEEG